MRALRLAVVSALLCASGLPAAALQAAAWTRMALRGDTRASCSVCLKAQDLAGASRTGIAAAPSARAELARPRVFAGAVLPPVPASTPLASFSPLVPASYAAAVTLPPPRARA